MELMGSEGELSSGYKLVPWSNWVQWNFVRESIFSSSPYNVAAALRRISAWRSRGCLPVPIDVTASFVEIQQRDPFFRKGPVVLESEEMLAMLYSMAIIRLVNCFVEPAHKKTRRSISELADAVGIPRVLVDIRHESSHRDLPALRLVRFASLKALDWLKDNYWEPQKNAIPDVRTEIRYRLHEMTYYLKTKNGQKASSGIKQTRAKQAAVIRACNKLSSKISVKLQSSKSDGSKRQISRTAKIIARLYSSYPLDVVSVLLEFFQLQAPDFYDGTGMEHSDSSDFCETGSLAGPVQELKTIISRLSSKRPRLLLSMLKNVLEIIETYESNKATKDREAILSCKNLAEICHIRKLCSLAHWLITNLKTLKDSGRLGLLDEAESLSMDKNALPKLSVTKLLHKFLALSVLGDKHLIDSILLLVEMMGDGSVRERIKQLPLLRPQDWSNMEDLSFPNTESTILQEEDLVKKAAEKLEMMKLRLNAHSNRSSCSREGNSDTTNIWTMTKSWIPCPIGMLPCSFSSTAVLPVLDKFKDESNSKVEIDEEKIVNPPVAEGLSDSQPELLERETAIKRLKLTAEGERLHIHNRSPMEGLLLINGMWQKVSEEQLLAMKSNIRSFM